MLKQIFIGFSLIYLNLTQLVSEITKPIFDLKELEDPSTLEIEVIDDWHVVKGLVDTRQKYIKITVGEFWPGQKYRVPVRMIVPVDQKAKGIHLTGGHRMKDIGNDAKLNAFDAELIRNGLGFVYTIIQTLESSGMRDLGQAVHKKFIETLNPRHAVKYWGWPASLMRCVTTAHAEKDHFEVGKVAMSGGSKNGASPTAALIHDKRLTAVHASVSPTHVSPLRQTDTKAWEELQAYDEAYIKSFKPGKYSSKKKVKPKHTFLGGVYGPIYNYEALSQGHTWEDLQELSKFMTKNYLVSEHLSQLQERGADIWFEPGTHDYVAYDVPYAGEHYPSIPMYLRVNSGHGIKSNHPGTDRGVQNKQAWLLEHFFAEVDELLDPPQVKSKVESGLLKVEVKFSDSNPAESGRLFWIYDRGPDGSLAYINDLFHDEHWSDMKFDAAKQAWVAEIKLDPKAKKIDFYSNHKKVISFKSKNYTNAISSPYQTITLNQ